MAHYNLGYCYFNTQRGGDAAASFHKFLSVYPTRDNLRADAYNRLGDEMCIRDSKNAYWGIRGNYRGMPTDCPQRDERLGWLGDRTTGALGESFIFDNALLYKKWLQDIYESRDAQGRISDVSPRTWTVYGDDVTWPAAYFYVADMLYRQFGDKSGIETHYQAMRKWMHYMQQNCMEDNVIITDLYGDWCMPPESPELIHSKDPSRKTRPEILGTTVYYSLLQMMSQFAQLTGNEADVDVYKRQVPGRAALCG